MVSDLEQCRQTWANEMSIWITGRCHSEKSLTPRIRRTSWRAHPSRSAKTHMTRTRKFLRRLLVQRSNWSTRRMATLAFNFKFFVVERIRMESEVSSHFFLLESLFCYSYRWLRSTETHGVCEQNTLTRVFSRTLVQSPFAHMHLHGSRCLRTCLRKHFHPHVITFLIVRCLSTQWSLPLFRVSLHLVQSLPLLYSAHPPCGRNRRVQEPLRTRRMRSMALWRYKTLSQSENKLALARSVTKWTSLRPTFSSCDLIHSSHKRLPTKTITDNIVMWETRLSSVDWVYFKTQVLLETLKTQNQPRVESNAFIGSRTLVTIRWMCKKPTSVSHSSTESEIVSLWW